MCACEYFSQRLKAKDCAPKFALGKHFTVLGKCVSVCVCVCACCVCYVCMCVSRLWRRLKAKTVPQDLLKGKLFSLSSNSVNLCVWKAAVIAGKRQKKKWRLTCRRLLALLFKRMFACVHVCAFVCVSQLRQLKARTVLQDPLYGNLWEKSVNVCGVCVMLRRFKAKTVPQDLLKGKLYMFSIQHSAHFFPPLFLFPHFFFLSSPGLGDTNYNMFCNGGKLFHARCPSHKLPFSLTHDSLVKKKIFFLKIPGTGSHRLLPRGLG